MTSSCSSGLHNLSSDNHPDLPHQTPSNPRAELFGLPVELYWKICSHVADYSLLNNLSLTNRKFHEATLPELYRTVKISALSPDSLAQFLALLPARADLIRRLTICTPSSGATAAASAAASSSPPAPLTDTAQLDLIANAIRNLHRLQAFEWNACKLCMPADILSAILLLPDLRALQTCSIPSTTYAPPPFQPRLRSLRILRLRSLDEARTVAGILHACRDTLACISIRVAERDDLADNVINDLEPRLWNPAPQNEDDGDEVDLTTTNLKSQFLHVLLTNPSSSEPLKLKIESLALFNFPRLSLDFLSSIVQFSGLHTLRLDTMDNQVLSTLSRDTVLPLVMKVLDLTFGKAAFPLTPTAAAPEQSAHEGQLSEIESRPPMMSTLLRDLRAVENLNLKLFCEPLTEGRVMSEYIAPWLLSLNSSSNNNNSNAREKHRYHQYHAHHHHHRHLRHSQRRQNQHDSRRHTQTHRRNQSTCTACAAAAAIATPSTPPVHLKKLSIHIWSIAAGQSIALAPWSLQDLQTLATSAAGRHIRSLAIDFSRHVIAFEDLVSHMQKLPALQHLYLNYTPTTYYGTGVYDICRRQATILKAALPGLELLWMNSIELVVPIRCKRSPSPSVSESSPHSTSTATNSGVSTPVVTERSVLRSGGVDGEAIERLATEGIVGNDDHHSIDDDDDEYAYDEEFEDDYEEEEEYEETAGYDEHFGDEFFADDNNFHIFATKLF